jgi:hypothetical protein
MAIRTTGPVRGGNDIVVSEGESKSNGPTFEYGPEGSRFKTSHTASVWGRLFARDKDGDLIIVELYKWLLSNHDDPATIRAEGDALADFLKSDKA